MNSFQLLESIWQDLRYAVRAMRKNLAFTTTAVLAVALGIGGNTAIFTVIRAVLLSPLEYKNPDQLVYISMESARLNQREVGFGRDRLEQVRASAQSLTDIGAYLASIENFTLSGAGEPEPLAAGRVSGNFLGALGVSPLLGRGFLPQEDKPGAPLVALIGEGLWRRRYNSDPLIIGKTATLDSKSYTIVGVLPAAFEFPFSGLDVWVTRPSEWTRFAPRYWGLPVLLGFARLKPHSSIEQARAELEVLSRQWAKAHPGLDSDQTMRVVPLKERWCRTSGPCCGRYSARSDLCC
jgi:hypothetical protein